MKKVSTYLTIVALAMTVVAQDGLTEEVTPVTKQVEPPVVEQLPVQEEPVAVDNEEVLADSPAEEVVESTATATASEKTVVSAQATQPPAEVVVASTPTPVMFKGKNIRVATSGDVQFRFRGEFSETIDDDGTINEVLTYNEYSNKFGWNARFDLSFGDDDVFAIKTRLSNPAGADMETVYSNGRFNKEWGDVIKVTLPRFEAIWSPNAFNMSIGILEVNNSAMLNVVRGSELGGYMAPFSISDDWDKYTNKSQLGIRVGATFDNFSLNLLYAMADFQKESKPESHADHRFIFDAPVKLGSNSKITPGFTIRTGINTNYQEGPYEARDRTASYTGGVDFSTKLSSAWKMYAGVAYGGFKDHPDSSNINSGLLMQVKPQVSFGMNKVSLGYSFSRGTEAASSISYNYNVMDFRWGFKVHKNFTIMPRVRAWYSTAHGSDFSYKKMRPELIFKGSF